MTAPVPPCPSRDTLWRLAVREALLGRSDMAWTVARYRELLAEYGVSEEEER